VLKLLDEAKINELVFPVGGRLARVALRATKEHMQKVMSREPAVQAGSSITGFSRAELGLPERDEAEERALRGRKPRKTAAAAKRVSPPARTTKRPVKPPRKMVAAKPAKPAKAAKLAKAAPKKKAVKKPARPVKKTKVIKKPAPKIAKAAPKKKAAAKKPAPKKVAPKGKKKTPARKRR